MLPLPPELVTHIATYLRRADLINFSLTCRTVHAAATPVLFRNILLLDEYVGLDFHHLFNSCHYIKAATRHLSLWQFEDFANSDPSITPIEIYQGISTFPNITSLSFQVEDSSQVHVLQNVQQFLSIIQYLPLKALDLDMSSIGHLVCPPSVTLAGLRSLKAISVTWNIFINEANPLPHSRTSYIQSLLQPSQGTLKSVTVYVKSSPLFEKVEIQSIMETIPQVSRLRLYGWRTVAAVHTPFTEVGPSLLKYRIMSKYVNARLELKLDFEREEGDNILGGLAPTSAWLTRCLIRRAKATLALARVCPNLRVCIWKQLEAREYPIRILHDGNHRTIQVMRQRWMSEDICDDVGNSLGPPPDGQESEFTDENDDDDSDSDYSSGSSSSVESDTTYDVESDEEL